MSRRERISASSCSSEAPRAGPFPLTSRVHSPFTRVRSDSTRQVRGRAVQVTTTYANHRKTDGMLFPRLIEVVAVGRPQQLRVVVDSIEINPLLSDERFEMWKDDE